MSKRGASRAGEGRTQHAQGLWVVPAEGNQGSFKVSPAALLRQPDLALAAAGSLEAAETAHLAPRARTLGAPPPGWPQQQSAERPERWRRCQRRRWCSREGGERVAPSAGRGVLCGAPRPPPPRQEDAQTGRGGRGARGGSPGVPTSASGHRAGRGRDACRRSPFVLRGAGPGGGQGALSSPDGGQTVPVGWGLVLSAFVPLPGLPALTLRSYCGRSAAGFGRSATDKARRAPRPQRRLRTEYGWPRRALCGPGLHPPGPPFMFVKVSQRPPGPRELGEAGERRHSGVGLPAVNRLCLYW